MLAKRLGQLASPAGSLLRAGSLATARPASVPRARRISMSSQSGDEKRKLWKDFDLPPSPLVGQGSTAEDRFFEVALCKHRPLYLDTAVSHLFSDSAATKRMNDYVKARPDEYAHGGPASSPLFPNAMSFSGQVTNPDMMHFSKNVTAELFPYEKYYSPQKSEFEDMDNVRSDVELLKFIGDAVKKFEAKNSDADLEMTSVKRKRRIKMNKHKYKKRRKAQRALRRKLDK